jgi:hypothetical protein
VGLARKRGRCLNRKAIMNASGMGWRRSPDGKWTRGSPEASPAAEASQALPSPAEESVGAPHAERVSVHGVAGMAGALGAGLSRTACQQCEGGEPTTLPPSPEPTLPPARAESLPPYIPLSIRGRGSPGTLNL